MNPRMPKIPPVMTHLDAQRLRELIASRAEDDGLDRLRREVLRATIIPAYSAPCDLVTMNSTVVYDDGGGDGPKKVTVVYPWREREDDAVSVLSPLGTSLLGMRVGRRGAIRVVAIAYQPEAAEEWHL